MKNIIFLFCSIFFFSYSSYSQLSGNYTIDATLPAGSGNYQSFTAAVNDLNTNGVSGAVVFDVAAGVYNEQITIEEIAGASSANTITFDGNDSSLAKIIDAATATATIILDSSDYIIIKNMTVENTGGSNAAILVGPGSNNNTISNNVLRVPPSGANSSIALTFSGLLTATTSNFQNPPDASYNTIQNNRIVNGYFGIWMEASSLNRNVSNKILDNIIDSTRYNNIHAFDQDSLIVKGNIIDATNPNVFTAVYFNGNTNAVFNQNIVEALSYGVVAQSTVDFEIINNMIVANPGLYLISSDSIEMYHNSLLATGGPAVDMTASSGHDIRNNIFDGGSGLAFSTSGDTSMFDHWDYNVYHTTGSALVQIGSNGFTDLSTLQNTYPSFNSNSLEGDPQFVSSTDLHVLYGSPLVSSKGDNSVGVTIDIDGQTRPIPASSFVDIGADEFDAPALNAAVTALVAPSGMLCPGTFSPIIEVSNTASDTITTIDIVYSLNSQLDTIHYNDTILPSGSQNITLNAVNFATNVQYDFIVYTDNPNGMNDAVPADDTLSFVLRTGLAGNYTINATLPPSATNFQSFTAAIDDLNTFGVCDSVYFDIAAGTYNEAVTVNEIQGVTDSSTVSFIGASRSSVNLMGTSSNDATIILDGADYINIGNMTIENTGTANSAIIFESGSNFNKVYETIIKVPQANISTSTSSIAFLINSDASYNTIDNNRILNGQSGLRIEGSTTAPNVNNKILNNYIDSVYAYSLYVNYQDSVEISGNTIISTDPAASGFVFGAYISNSVNSIFWGNRITSKTYGAMIQTFNIPSASTLERKLKVVNNMIHSSGYYGIWIQGTDSVDIYHNTISVDGNVPALRIDDGSNGISDYDVRNNILDGGGDLALETDAAANTLFDKLDYNLYYSSGTDLADVNGVVYADLNSIQAAFPNLNDSSIFGNPQFVSATDLHMVTPIANNVGDNSVGVNIDIDGETRPFGNDTVVDIGADEYTITTLDLAIAELSEPIHSVEKCYTASEAITVDIINLGLDSIDFTSDSATITVVVSGVSMHNFDTVISSNAITNGNLFSPFASDTISLTMGHIDMLTPGIYAFDVSLTFGPDVNLSNNNLMDTVVVQAPTGGDISGDDTICFGSTALLHTTSTVGSNLQWQWLDGRNWVDIQGADSSFIIVSPTVNTSYRTITCGNYFAATDSQTVEVINISLPTASGGTDTVVCGDTGTVYVHATPNSPNSYFNWYDSAVGGNKITPTSKISISGDGDSLIFSAKPIGKGFPQTDTFYVEEIIGNSGFRDTLTIEPYTGGSSCNGGTMFNVVGKENLTISGFMINSYTSGWQTVDVYMKNGTYLNATSSTTSWTLVESVNVFGNGIGDPSNLLLSNHINAGMGDTIGIYLDYNAVYTPVTMGTTYSNNDMDVIVGHAFCKPISLNPKPGNAFNGEILYSTGCVSSRVQVIASIECDIPTSINENGHGFQDLKIQPNPTAGEFSISGFESDDLNIEIYNSSGKLVRTVNKVNLSTSRKINLSNFPNGIYFVKLQSGSSIEMRKLILQ